MYKSEHIITSKHYLILSICAFALGIYFTVSLSASSVFNLAIFLAALLVVLAILLLCSLRLRFSKNKRIKHILLPLILVLFTLLGMLRILTVEALFPAPLKAFVDDEAWFSGTVTTPVSKTSNGFSCYFEFRITDINGEKIKPETIVMYIPESRIQSISEGDTVRCWTKLSIPSRKNEMDNLDYYTHLRGKNIFYIGETNNATHVTLEKSDSLVIAILDLGEKIKQSTISAIDGLIPENPQYASILKGIIIGDKSDFSDELYDKFSNSGLSHIAAVSGLHLSVLFSVLTLLFYKIKIHRKLAFLFLIPIVIIFSSATEFTPSVCRSALMVLIMIISNLCGERYSPINALFLSWGIILFFSPYSLFSKSLVLSFGATFGILACFEHLQRLWNRLIKLPTTRNKRLEKIMVSSKKFLGGSLSISISAFVGTVYFCAVFFGSISKVQFLTNLWIVPVANLAFCIGAIACIIYSFLPHFALAVFFYPLRLLLWIITTTIDTFGAEKFAFKILGEISPVFLIIYIGAAILFYETIKTFSDIQKEKAAKERAARKKLKNP